MNNVCIPTRGVLSLCFYDQYMVCSVLIEPKMSSGGHRAAEKSSVHPHPKIEPVAAARAAPRASPPCGRSGVLRTPGITAAAAAPGAVIKVMPGVGPTPPVRGLLYRSH